MPGRLAPVIRDLPVGPVHSHDLYQLHEMRHVRLRCVHRCTAFRALLQTHLLELLHQPRQSLLHRLDREPLLGVALRGPVALAQELAELPLRGLRQRPLLGLSLGGLALLPQEVGELVLGGLHRGLELLLALRGAALLAQQLRDLGLGGDDRGAPLALALRLQLQHALLQRRLHREPLVDRLPLLREPRVPLLRNLRDLFPGDAHGSFMPGL
mmetsp:Transcript_101722/g.287953  ORF Transcript_101722/g.287953 Transcript_101722/m.287953 type:complete len:212 (+) Transcript_101722:407-1042(+)